MISADVKANKNNKKQKIWWLYLINFCKTYLQINTGPNIVKYSKKIPAADANDFFNVDTTFTIHTVLSSLPCVTF